MSGLDPGYLSFTDAIVKLTEELIATKKERDAALAALKSTHEQLEANGHILDTDTTAAIRMVELEKCITSAKAAAESADVSYRAYLRALDRAEKAEERAEKALAEAREMRRLLYECDTEMPGGLYDSVYEDDDRTDERHRSAELDAACRLAKSEALQESREAWAKLRARINGEVE